METGQLNNKIWEKLLEAFKERNLEQAKHAEAVGASYTASCYRKYNDKLDRFGKLVGYGDTWAADSFAYAFLHYTNISSDRYEELFGRMFC